MRPTLRFDRFPLADETIGATTGFRWYFPEDGGFWPLLRSVWDSTIAGNMNTKDRNFAWGGGMAVRRATFEQARVAEFWKGTVSDDYRLTAALNKARLGIRFVPGGMVATTLEDIGSDKGLPPEEILALDSALERLELQDPRLRALVEYRFFGGLSDKEIAELLQVSERTVNRDWAKARAWLHKEVYPA